MNQLLVPPRPMPETVKNCSISLKYSILSLNAIEQASRVGIITDIS
jgi:hypothetical protein